jgi:hypothetical protein
VPSPQRRRDLVHQLLIVENEVDLAEDAIPQLVGVGEQDFDQGTLRVGAPDHGASDEAGRPQGLPCASCAAAPRAGRPSALLAHHCAQTPSSSTNFGTIRARSIGGQIPAIRDRVVQGALKLIIEPIFEADFHDGSYGYRPKQTAGEAVARVAEAIVHNKTRVIDLDLADYFGTVRRDLLFGKVARRIRDAEILHVLRLMVMRSRQESGVREIRMRCSIGRGLETGS